MPDREKVLQGLECCIRKMEGQRVCDECPYDEDFNCLGCSVVLKQAIALLREQEPVKPKTDDAWPYPIKVCGACGTCLFNVGDFKAKFCSECGRKVKWE